MRPWSDRLAKELDALTATLTLRGSKTALPVDNFRLLLSRLADSPHENVDTLYQSVEPIDTSTLVELLREHPAIRDNTFDDEFQVLSVNMAVPNGYSQMPISELAACLLKTTIVSSGPATADLLLRYLSIGDAQTMPAFEVTLLGGLTAKTEFEVFPGLEILPHDQAIERGLSTRVTARDVFQGTPNLEMMRPLCIVCSARLGPGLVSADSIRAKGTDVATIEYNWSGHSRLATVLDLLPLATNSGLDVLGTSFAVPEFRGLNPFFAPSHPRASRAHNQLRSRNELTPASVGRLRTMLKQFTGFKQADQPRLSLAARRLGSALSRSEGAFPTADAILDVTIALEVMYSLGGGGEIQNKMGIRLAHFLGNGPDDRYDLFECVRSLYSLRSAITHGRTAKANHGAVLEAALDLGQRTFSRLLDRGKFLAEKDWTKISVGHG